MNKSYLGSGSSYIKKLYRHGEESKRKENSQKRSSEISQRKESRENRKEAQKVKTRLGKSTPTGVLFIFPVVPLISCKALVP